MDVLDKENISIASNTTNLNDLNNDVSTVLEKNINHSQSTANEQVQDVDNTTENYNDNDNDNRFV